MNWHTIKRDKTDALFSRYIRLRDGGRCVYTSCTYRGTGDEGIVGLDCSHFHSRRKESVRFDPENADSICRSHHRWLGEHKTEYEQFKLEQLGQQRYDLLAIRAQTYKKKDRVMEFLVVKELMKSLS